jgi:hypothetical protein
MKQEHRGRVVECKKARERNGKIKELRRMSEERGLLDWKMCALLDMVQAALKSCFGSLLAESVAFVQVG